MPVGRISINTQRESRLDGTLLAIRGQSDPFGEATAFLASRGIGNGDMAQVSGAGGAFGGQAVFFMTGATLVNALAALGANAARARKRAAKQSTTKKRAPKAAKAKVIVKKAAKAARRDGRKRS
ncbi:MAG: hypothetical protein HXY18_08635 [Bryobacteraceae bacterium]|nr:hypothetical protein [Bryobacteraceae bacterium]